MGNSNIVSWILIGIFLVAIVIIFVKQSRSQKKAQEDYLAMLDKLRPGVKVKMASGLLGRIKEIREDVPGFKTVTLKIGEDKNTVEMTFVIEAVQGIVNEEAINQLKIEKALADAKKVGEVKTIETAAVNVDDDVKNTSSNKKTTNKRK